MAAERWVGWVVTPIVTIIAILLAIVSGSTIAMLRPEMKGSDWAAWVQAIGSIAAICAGFGYVYVQRRWQDNEKERDRDARGEIVAFRLSGWLSEVGSRIKVKSDEYAALSWDGSLPQPHQIIQRWKLEISNGIEDVMPDLHYLRAGSGDIAQLAFLTRYFDTLLDQAHIKSLAKAKAGSLIPYDDRECEDIYKNVGRQLELMRRLHFDADRRLAPVIDRAVAREV
jgi:hypothetical protein